MRCAYLIIEKTTTGSTLVSWNSLDDNSTKRMILSAVTLDPVWEEFESAYLDQHGNHFFALNPRLGTPVTFTAAAVTLGTLDTAMIADFTSHLSEITANIANGVALAALYSHQPAPSGDRRFYRVAADWSVDSDADGRFDWQELIFDGNNPFAADSDGDGQPDQAPRFAGGSGSGTGSGYPEPTDAQGSTPLALVQQVTIGIHREFTDFRDETQQDYIQVIPGWEEFIPGCAQIVLDETQDEAALNAGTFAALAGVVRFDLAQPGPVDPDGACVTTSELFTVKFGNDAATTIPNQSWPRPAVHWYKRKLLGNGTLENNEDGSPKWARMGYDYDNRPFQGTHVSLKSLRAGIYQLQARMVLPEGEEIEFPFVRLRDAKRKMHILLRAPRTTSSLSIGSTPRSKRSSRR